MTDYTTWTFRHQRIDMVPWRKSTSRTIIMLKPGLPECLPSLENSGGAGFADLDGAVEDVYRALASAPAGSRTRVARLEGGHSAVEPRAPRQRWDMHG